MGKEPEVIEKDIAETREDLSRNFDELADRVSPGRVVSRKVDNAKGKLGNVKDKVMGSAHSTSDSLSGATSAAGDTLSGAAEGVTARTEGNPLAAGVIAFGAGLLVSSLIPPSEAETKAAGQLASAARLFHPAVSVVARDVPAQQGDGHHMGRVDHHSCVGRGDGCPGIRWS